jgi:hypothetical protein
MIFTSSEINTGATDGKYIIITRKEEALKTIIHELIHFYNLDHRQLDTELEEQLTTLLKINNKLDSLNIFEAYTETLASFLNILFSHNTNKLNNTNSTLSSTLSKQQITEQMLDQICYTLFKLCRVLVSSGCTRLGDPSDQCKLVQTTNVASYFMIKSFLYIMLSDLTRECIDPTTLHSCSPYKLKEIILKGANSRLLAQIIEYIMSKPDDSRITETTARMTCLT